MQFLKIKKAVLTPDKYGHTMTISMIGLYDQEQKFVKWIKIKEAYDLLMDESAVFIVYPKDEK